MKPWKLKRENGHLDAESEEVSLRIEGDEDECRAFMRNAVSTRNGGTHKRTLVGELNGVRLYITDEGMLMTKRDVY
jgi:hypothetical protein